MAGADRRLDLAERCAAEAERFDGVEDGHIGVMAGLVVRVRDALRLRNGLLDDVLLLGRRSGREGKP